MMIKGENLSPSQRAAVLAAFIHRWTVENPHRTRVYWCELCDIRTPYVNTASSEGHTHPTLPLSTDDEWIRTHAFHFTRDGARLMNNRRYADPVYLAGKD